MWAQFLIQAEDVREESGHGLIWGHRAAQVLSGAGAGGPQRCRGETALPVSLTLRLFQRASRAPACSRPAGDFGRQRGFPSLRTHRRHLEVSPAPTMLVPCPAGWSPLQRPGHTHVWLLASCPETAVGICKIIDLFLGGSILLLSEQPEPWGTGMLKSYVSIKTPLMKMGSSREMALMHLLSFETCWHTPALPHLLQAAPRAALSPLSQHCTRHHAPRNSNHSHPFNSG